MNDNEDARAIGEERVLPAGMIPSVLHEDLTAERRYGQMAGSYAIDRLAMSLAKAQGEYSPIKKTKCVTVNSDRGKFEYYYADLADVMNMALPVLSRNGLCVLQSVSNENQQVEINTQVIHESGQYLRGSMVMPLQDGNRMSSAQKLGATITYLRRYHLSMMLGLVSEDDLDDNTGDGAGDRDREKDKHRPSAQGVQADHGRGNEFAGAAGSVGDSASSVADRQKLEQQKRNFLINELKEAMDCAGITEEMRKAVKEKMDKKPATADIQQMVNFYTKYKADWLAKNANKSSDNTEPSPEPGSVASLAVQAAGPVEQPAISEADQQMLIDAATKSFIPPAELIASVFSMFSYSEGKITALKAEDFAALWESVKSRKAYDEFVQARRAESLSTQIPAEGK